MVQASKDLITHRIPLHPAPMVRDAQRRQPKSRRRNAPHRAAIDFAVGAFSIQDLSCPGMGGFLKKLDGRSFQFVQEGAMTSWELG